MFVNNGILVCSYIYKNDYKFKMKIDRTKVKKGTSEVVSLFWFTLIWLNIPFYCKDCFATNDVV